MKRSVETILEAYQRIPAELQGFETATALAFHGWLFSVVIELLAPEEDQIVRLLAHHGEKSTQEIGELLADMQTAHQIGATLSRLRRLKLVHTIRERGVAYHALDGWVTLGAAVWLKTEPF